jgi:hypothetical protein
MRRRMYKQRLTEVTDEIEEQVRFEMTFEDIPLDKRIKSFEVLYDENKIEAIYKRVEECRKYLQSIGVESTF